jgi:NTE family protein
MGRIRSALPWGVIVLFGVLFCVAWWLEDCLIYAVNWDQFYTVRLGLDVLGILGSGIRSAGHLVWVGIARGSSLIAQGFDELPAEVRETWPMRVVAWTAGSMVATFGGDALVDFGLRLRWGAGRLVMTLIALNGAGWFYNFFRRFLDYASLTIHRPIRFYAEREDREKNAEDAGASASSRASGAKRQRRREYLQFFDSHVSTIGIILPGGGAKGAYQAGALKAIYEFLQTYNALNKVRMIAGTSTGAWNAMFWLAGMMDQEGVDRPCIERWWKSLSFGRVLDFSWLYIPFWSNSILRTAPWRERFLELFRKRIDHLFGEDPDIHFYFTRCDLTRGISEYATNWQAIGPRVDELGLDKDDRYRFFDVIEAGEDALVRTAGAVFSSITLPPLSPPAKIDGNPYEDGGMMESIPLRFATPLEECDLLFVLPNDGTSERSPARYSMVKRMLRVMDSRQEALGHMALKNADLINRMSETIERIQFGIDALAPSIPAEGLAAEALEGLHDEIAEFNERNRRLHIFTICPRGRLELGNFDFWKRHEAENAFDLMYVQTLRELQVRFFEDIEPEDARVVMVDGLAPTGDELPKPHYRRPAQL